jgi:uncharacterized protein
MVTMIPRTLQPALLTAARQMPVVALTGPRQSGKTTLARTTFPKKPYVTLERPDQRQAALEDAQLFLQQYPQGAIIDEVQYAPDLFSYIQTIVDEQNQPGMFILTGSHNFLLMENISQSLAGRVALHTLLPLSLAEVLTTAPAATLEERIYAGGYPRIFDQHLSPTSWHSSYVQTYVERDVRLLKNIGNLTTFHRFLKVCAGRCGQLINLSAIADDCGLNYNTVRSWISVLEASYIVFLLQPHHRNFNKRLKKAPKLYFYDTGLLCMLLGITKPSDIVTHAARGALFENYILSDLMKRYYHGARTPELYFWRDRRDREIDCIIERGDHLTPVEIKSGATIASDHFRHLTYWREISGTAAENAYLIYAGDESHLRKQGNALSWRDLDQLPL